MWCFGGGGGVTARADSGPIYREGEVGRENQASLKSPKIQAWGAGGGGALMAAPLPGKPRSAMGPLWEMHCGVVLPSRPRHVVR